MLCRNKYEHPGGEKENLRGSHRESVNAEAEGKDGFLFAHSEFNCGAEMRTVRGATASTIAIGKKKARIFLCWVHTVFCGVTRGKLIISKQVRIHVCENKYIAMG